jgi:hypothetical protein
MRNIVFAAVVPVVLFIAGCCTCDPTVIVLRNTIKAVRVDDYEKGRVTYSSTASINSRVLAGKIERLKMAENNAAVHLKEPVPFPELLKTKKEKKVK